MKYRFPIAPSPKPRMTRWDTWKPKAQRYFQFKDKLVELASDNQFYNSKQLPNLLEIHFFIGMPKSWSKTKKQRMHLQGMQQTPDIDNFLKAFLDSLYESDKEVWHVDVTAVWVNGESGILVVKRDAERVTERASKRYEQFLRN